MAYLNNSVNDVFHTFVMHILSALLVDGEASPIYKARMERDQIGKDFLITGYTANAKECFFSVGIQGIKEEQIPMVFEMVDSTLRQVAQQGFSQERIESVLHRIELAQKHTPSL